MHDQVQGGVRKAFGERLVARRPQGPEDPVHVALVGGGEAEDALARGRVRAQLLFEGGEAKRLDQIVHDASAHGGTQALDLARGGDRDHVHRGMVIVAQPLQHLQP